MNEEITLYDADKKRIVTENLRIVKNLGERWGRLDLYHQGKLPNGLSSQHQPVRAKDVEEDLQNYRSIMPLKYAGFTLIGTEEQAREDARQAEIMNKTLSRGLEGLTQAELNELDRGFEDAD